MIANIAQAYDLEIAAGTQDNGVGASVQDAHRTWVFFRTVIENSTRADGFFSTVIPK
jgi:hypothetical protein